MKMESIFVVAALLFYSCGLLSNPSIEPPTRHKTSDKAGVNVASGRSSFSLDTISIGAGDLSLQHKMMSNNDNFYVAFDNFWGYMYRTESSSVGSKLEFNFGNQVETISYPANFLSPDFVEHSSSAPKRKLKKLNATTYEFTTSAGTVYEYSTVMAPAAPFHASHPPQPASAFRARSRPPHRQPRDAAPPRWPRPAHAAAATTRRSPW